MINKKILQYFSTQCGTLIYEKVSISNEEEFHLNMKSYETRAKTRLFELFSDTRELVFA